MRDLQHRLARFPDRVERGEVIEIRRHGKTVARLTPYRPDEPAEPWPDVEDRLERIYPDRPQGRSASRLIYEDR